MDYQDRITVNPLIRSGKPTIRGMRITVADVLGWLASGMTNDEILLDYPELTLDDIYICLAYATDSQNRIVSLKAHETAARRERFAAHTKAGIIKLI